MLEGRYYGSLDEAYLFVVAFIDPSAEYEKTAPIKMVNTRYSQIFADVTGDMRQPAWAKNIWGAW